MNEIILELDNLYYKAGNFSLREINLRLNTGEYLTVMGPTGAGKTILLEIIAGLRRISQGRIYFNGFDITDTPPENRFLGFAYQDSLLYPFLNVRDNILFGVRARGLARDLSVQQRLVELSDIMEITPLWNRFPRYLSGGEKQRVSLARALLPQPPLLLLDEPLASLDSRTKQNLQRLLREIHSKEKVTVIHVTHDFDEARQLGTGMLTLHEGKFIT